MKIHLRADTANGVHTRFTVFVNGANCGQLCMRDEEAVDFYLAAQEGYARRGEFLGSGEWAMVESHTNAEKEG